MSFFLNTKRIEYFVDDWDFLINSFAKFSFKYVFKIFNSFWESAYMSSNVNCFLDFNLISWSHDWCLNKVVVVVFSRNKCFQFLYICDICLVVSLDVLTFSRILKDAWNFSLSLTSWLVWLVSMLVKSIFVVRVSLIKVANFFLRSIYDFASYSSSNFVDAQVKLHSRKCIFQI